MENNFTSRVKQPWTTYDNGLIQDATIFKSANQKLCYMFLYSYANASKIFPSIDKIAQAVCCKRRTAITVIQELEEIGLIEVIRTPGKANQYILNDYFEVSASLLSEEDTSAKIAPVQKLHDTSAKIAPVPVQNLHTKTKTKKLKTKNKISSSVRDSIDSKLREKYSNAPFDDIKNEMLNDSVTVDTDKQYKSLLEYRLKHWKPKQGKKQSVTRKEIVPKWLNDKDEVANGSKTLSNDFEAEKEKIKAELLQLDADLKAGNR